MGQYHAVVNLDKKEFISPWDMGSGAKAWEQAANSYTTPAGMFMLMVCPKPRGGGDFAQNDVAGRWHGDRVVIVGDYAEAGDMETVDASNIWGDLFEGDEYTNISVMTLENLITEGTAFDVQLQALKEALARTEAKAA